MAPLAVIPTTASARFTRRAATWDLTGLPVPADVLVYTEDEWRRLDQASRFARVLAREVVWVWVTAP